MRSVELYVYLLKVRLTHHPSIDGQSLFRFTENQRMLEIQIAFENKQTKKLKILE